MAILIRFNRSYYDEDIRHSRQESLPIGLEKSRPTLFCLWNEISSCLVVQQHATQFLQEHNYKCEGCLKFFRSTTVCYYYFSLVVRMERGDLHARKPHILKIMQRGDFFSCLWNSMFFFSVMTLFIGRKNTTLLKFTLRNVPKGGFGSQFNKTEVMLLSIKVDAVERGDKLVSHNSAQRKSFDMTIPAGTVP